MVARCRGDARRALAVRITAVVAVFGCGLEGSVGLLPENFARQTLWGAVTLALREDFVVLQPVWCPIECLIKGVGWLILKAISHGISLSKNVHGPHKVLAWLVGRALPREAICNRRLRPIGSPTRAGSLWW